MAINKRYWSEEENLILLERYTWSEKDEILNLLTDRAWPEIQAKANRLGLRRARYPSKKRFWTSEELDSLKERYPLMTKTELTETFPGRSLPSIYAQAQRLNLRRAVGGPIWAKREEIVLKNMLEEGATKVEIECEFRDKSWPQILKKITRMGMSFRAWKKKAS